MNSYIDFFDEYLTLEAIALIKKFKSIDNNVNYDKLSFVGGNKKLYGFKNFKVFEKLIKDLHNRNMMIGEAKSNQYELAVNVDKLRAY